MKTEQKRYPSMDKRWVKNPRKVKTILDDLQKNHNHSWYQEIMKRNKHNLDGLAIFYRGNEITYRQMLEHAEALARALKRNGFTKGDEIVACLPNIPETIYLLLAANRLGVIVNFIGAGFAPECIKSICNDSGRRLLIVSDSYFFDLAESLDVAEFENCVVVSLANSLPNHVDPYAEYDNEFYVFTDKTNEIQEKYPVLSYDAFIRMGADYTGNIDDDSVDLDTEFTITYTSGSTKIGWPKAIVHTNRTYISIGRFHDSDVSRMPAMRNMRGLAHILPHSNTDIASCISDPLMQTCAVACEPIYNEHFFARSILINEPSFAAATRSFWICAMKHFKNDKELTGKTLPFLVNAVAVGEDISPNEERYINKLFKKLNAGCAKLPKPLSPITISVGGGNCEHGGLFFTLLKGTREKFSASKESYGLIPFQLAELAVLREDGTECDYNEMGLLVANSSCTMKEYRGNQKATEEFYIRDAYGRIWGNCNVWAYIDKRGNVHMRGRVGNEIHLKNGATLPVCKISDVVLQSPHILSCETVIRKDSQVVSYIEWLEESNCSVETLIPEIKDRVAKTFGMQLLGQYDIRIVPDTSYSLTKSGKRNIAVLEDE